MNFSKKYFPILFLFFLALSCTQKKKKSPLVVTPYSVLIAKAGEKVGLNQSDSAFYYYNKAKLVCKKGDDQNTVYALLMMGQLQSNLADYGGLEATMTEALEVIKTPTYYPYIYNLLGVAYQEQFDYDLAVLYYKKSLEKTSNEYDKALIRNNIALLYMYKNEYPKAIKILEPLTKVDTLYKNKLGYAKIIDNLGYSYYKSNNTLALKQLKLGGKIRDSLKNDYERIPSLLHLAEFYQKSNPQLALDYSRRAYEAATIVNSPDDRLLSLDFIIKNSSGEMNKKYYFIHSSLSDSIIKVRKIAKNQFSKIKYDSKKITLENEKNKSLKITLFILLITLIIVFIGFYFISKYRNKQKVRATVYDTETRIAKKLHDELANDVYNVMTFAETQDLQNHNKKETLLDNLDKIYLQTRNISKANSEIETDENYESYLKDMLSCYINKEVNVIVNKNSTIDWSKIEKGTKIAIYRVLQELMVNMKKHSQSSLVVIKFENHRKTIEISYSDNGKGCPEMLKFKKGLQNVENRILAIKGTCNFETETNKGFKVKMIIPK